MRRNRRQLELELRIWGGRRKGAGRKPQGKRRRVNHHRRPTLNRNHPVQVTMRIADDLPSLRSAPEWNTIIRCMCRAKERFGMRVVEYSVQGNHLHLIVEARGKDSLSRGMRGLTTRLAKQLNKLWERRGTVFPHRYHARALSTPREVRSALAYVLLNRAHHELDAERRRDPVAAPKPRALTVVDPRSTGPRFGGWRMPVHAQLEIDFGRLPPRTWLLRVGWKRHGLLGPDDIPGLQRRTAG